ncbi:hypothetical protein Anas_10839 [Armadillidium nasatum]|uniref:HAT C-terminal dimerisation domain-containing protein n=1 Tax=Armadillidium nasatum TaxID=96803 RepID=A0A5N5TDP3_9CRUS|nr:hypothetical protein Anas_10839 [Armadillidium nasatum]
MAGRKQTPVYSLFSIKENQSYKGKRALCRLCFTEVANNGSRKEQHILNCKKCSDDIKMKYLGNQKESKSTAKSRKRKQSYNKQCFLPFQMGSYIECLNSLLLNKQPLRSLAIDDDPLVSKVLTKPRVTKLLNEVFFWEKVEGFQRLFLPIAKTIKTVEGDEPHLSSVIQFLNSILEEVENTSIVTPLFKKEEADFVDIVKKRMSFCISNIHLAANLLDPRYRGKDLSPTENVQAFQKVYNLSREMLDVDENKNWQIFPVRGASLSNNVSSTAWWIGLCKHCEISKVASRILDLPAISAACERSFSAQANIHSKKRNRLTNEHAEKLLFVSHNLKLTETEQPEFSGNCSQINVEVGSGQTSNQIHHTETTYTIGQSSQPGSSGFSTPLSIALSQSLTPSSSSNIPYEDEESDLSVEAMIGNRSEDSDAEAVEQEFNEALDGSLEIW